MADEPENLVLHDLRRLDEKVDGLREVKARLASLEHQVAGVPVDFAHMRQDLVRLEERIDRFDRRMQRMERALNPTDAEP